MAYIDDDGKVLEGVAADLAEHRKACYIDELEKLIRVNKTMNNLQAIWNDLDSAYENMEKAIEKMSAMIGLPDELEQEINNFDISAISSLKQHVESMMDGLND